MKPMKLQLQGNLFARGPAKVLYLILCLQFGILFLKKVPKIVKDPTKLLKPVFSSVYKLAYFKTT